MLPVDGGILEKFRRARRPSRCVKKFRTEDLDPSQDRLYSLDGSRPNPTASYALLEGERLISRAIKVGVPISMMMLDGKRSYPLIEEFFAEYRDRLRTASPAELDEFTEGRSSSPIIALAQLPEQVVQANRLLAQVKKTHPPLILVDLEEPGNVGAIARTALGLAIPGIIAVGKTDLFHPKALRTSMGALFKIPCLSMTWPDLKAWAEKESWQLRAAVCQGGEELSSFSVNAEKHAWVLGNEAEGLSASVISDCARAVTVTQNSDVDSFSVHVAAALLGYESQRAPVNQSDGNSAFNGGIKGK